MTLLRVYRRCHFCGVAKQANTDNVCVACDEALILADKEAARTPVGPKRYCRDCKVLLPVHKYFKCDGCDADRETESEFDACPPAPEWCQIYKPSPGGVMNRYNTQGHKQCIRCKVHKPTSAYYRIAGTKDGLTGACKECRCTAQRRGVLTNKQIGIAPMGPGTLAEEAEFDLPDLF